MSNAHALQCVCRKVLESFKIFFSFNGVFNCPGELYLIDLNSGKIRLWITVILSVMFQNVYVIVQVRIFHVLLLQMCCLTSEYFYMPLFCTWCYLYLHNIVMCSWCFATFLSAFLHCVLDVVHFGGGGGGGGGGGHVCVITRRFCCGCCCSFSLVKPAMWFSPANP